ncbi:UNVERIFIED_CONTAM: hypothetical protein RMT77_004181 [Armadillidium vulgare]
MDEKIVVPTLPTHGYSTVYVYPTISPHIVVIPILSCIFGFPILVLLIICALRNRARKARLKAKKRRPPEHTITELVAHTTFSQSRYFNERVIRMKDGKRKTIVRFKPMPELDLDTVVEEKSEFDAEVSVNTELLESKTETSGGNESHTASFRSYRYGYGASGQLLKAQNACSTPSIEVTNFTSTNQQTLEMAPLKSYKQNINYLKDEKPETFSSVREKISSTGIGNLLQNQKANFPVKDSGSVTPITPLGSNSTLRESSTTISSKELDSVYPSATALTWFRATVHSPVKCQLKDIGGFKNTPSFICIKDKRIEKPIEIEHNKQERILTQNKSIIIGSRDIHCTNKERRESSVSFLHSFETYRECRNNKFPNIVQKKISKSEEGLLWSASGDQENGNSINMDKIHSPLHSKSDDTLVEAVTRNSETISNFSPYVSSREDILVELDSSLSQNESFTQINKSTFIHPKSFGNVQRKSTPNCERFSNEVSHSSQTNL